MIFYSLVLLQQSAIPELDGLVSTLIGGLSVIGILLGVMFFVGALIWLILPFGVFGIKRRLDNIAQWQQAIFEELRKINHTLSREDDPQ